jgi:F-type H+-transporting ATPase subunit gamma
MSQNYERVVARLNNLKAIEPLLGALRTISMGTWQMAQNNLNKINQYEAHFNQILAEILPMIEEKVIHKSIVHKRNDKSTDAFILVIGSERGLCGNFNTFQAENALNWISEGDFQSVRIGAIGSRMIQTLSKMSVTLSWRHPLPTSDLSSYRRAYLLTQDWIRQFESFHFNRLFVLSSEMAGENQFKFSSVKLLPYEPHFPIAVKPIKPAIWPPPIIETDPRGIYNQIIQHDIAATFYKILLRSAIAENASRYIMMEEAKQNAQDIIEELNREVNIERKRQITQETQELAVGAGLIDNK